MRPIPTGCHLPERCSPKQSRRGMGVIGMKVYAAGALLRGGAQLAHLGRSHGLCAEPARRLDRHHRLLEPGRKSTKTPIMPGCFSTFDEPTMRALEEKTQSRRRDLHVLQAAGIGVSSMTTRAAVSLGFRPKRGDPGSRKREGLGHRPGNRATSARGRAQRCTKPVHRPLDPGTQSYISVLYATLYGSSPSCSAVTWPWTSRIGATDWG